MLPPSYVNLLMYTSKYKRYFIKVIFLEKFLLEHFEIFFLFSNNKFYCHMEHEKMQIC